MNLQVIIPVGPGHSEIVQRAVESVGVAMSYSMGEFESVKALTVIDANGEMGRSRARNHGVETATADWLFFLDADDLMHPEALHNSMGVLPHKDAVFGLTTELVNGNVLTRYQVPQIEDYDTLIKHDPFTTIKMGHFVRREVAAQIPFHEEMNCGEDWEYYLRLWKGHECVKVNRPFFIKVAGNHSTGPKSATGRDWNVAVDKLLKKARQEMA